MTMYFWDQPVRQMQEAYSSLTDLGNIETVSGHGHVRCNRAGKPNRARVEGSLYAVRRIQGGRVFIVEPRTSCSRTLLPAVSPLCSGRRSRNNVIRRHAQPDQPTLVAQTSGESLSILGKESHCNPSLKPSTREGPDCDV